MGNLERAENQIRELLRLMQRAADLSFVCPFCDWFRGDGHQEACPLSNDSAAWLQQNPAPPSLVDAAKRLEEAERLALDAVGASTAGRYSAEQIHLLAVADAIGSGLAGVLAVIVTPAVRL